MLLGGLPLWAARRVIHPFSTEPAVPDVGALREALRVLPEKVEFKGRDGKMLSGWFVPAPEDAPNPSACIVMVHGYGAYKEQMAAYARTVRDGGFSSLLFDTSGSGLRRGEPVTLGFKERWQLMDAVHFVRSRADVDPERVGVLGVSMGGAAALLAAAEDPAIKSIVVDSAYADLSEMIKPGLRAFVGSPSLLFAPLIVFYAEAMLGLKSKDIRPDLAAAQLGDRPVLVIHGADDGLTDPRSADAIYEAASGPKELWVLPECGHACAPLVEPEEYKRRVNGFFQRTL
jgi:dipeptidyl aminopeptidase/acylaminoacyl peptidase